MSNTVEIESLKQQVQSLKQELQADKRYQAMRLETRRAERAEKHIQELEFQLNNQQLALGRQIMRNEDEIKKLKAKLAEMAKAKQEITRLGGMRTVDGENLKKAQAESKWAGQKLQEKCTELKSKSDIISRQENALREREASSAKEREVMKAEIEFLKKQLNMKGNELEAMKNRLPQGNSPSGRQKTQPFLPFPTPTTLPSSTPRQGSTPGCQNGTLNNPQHTPKPFRPTGPHINPQQPYRPPIPASGHNNANFISPQDILKRFGQPVPKPGFYPPRPPPPPPPPPQPPLPTAPPVRRVVPCVSCHRNWWNDECDNGDSEGEICENCRANDTHCERPKCSHFEKGTCVKGKTCTRAHEDDAYGTLQDFKKDLKRKMPKAKSEESPAAKRRKLEAQGAARPQFMSSTSNVQPLASVVQPSTSVVHPSINANAAGRQTYPANSASSAAIHPNSEYDAARHPPHPSFAAAVPGVPTNLGITAATSSASATVLTPTTGSDAARRESHSSSGAIPAAFTPNQASDTTRRQSHPSSEANSTVFTTNDEAETGHTSPAEPNDLMDRMNRVMGESGGINYQDSSFMDHLFDDSDIQAYFEGDSTLDFTTQSTGDEDETQQDITVNTEVLKEMDDEMERALMEDEDTQEGQNDDADSPFDE